MMVEIQDKGCCMLRLVIGGSASGKSEYAEKLILSLSGEDKVDYIATMKCYDEETRERILRHQRRRDGRRFVTVEHEMNLPMIEADSLHSYGMLECVSNLLANEMFSGDKTADVPEGAGLSERIASEICNLAYNYREFVVVTNDIFEDSIVYDEITREYIRELGEINRLLAERADSVTEVVCGIPLTIK